MLKDKKGLYFTINKVIATTLQKKFIQLTITIPKKDWKCFPVGGRARIFSKEGIDLVRKVRAIGGGKQRIINIPASDNDIFKKDDEVRIYPLNQPKISKSQTIEDMNKQKNDEQTNKNNKKD